MKGSFAEAKDAAQRVVANVGAHVKDFPMLEGFMPTPMLVLLAFERWDDVLKLPTPDSSLSITNAVWHFARGMALANVGKTAEAEKEQLAWQETVAKIPPETMYDQLNKTGAVFKIHENLLLSAIARSRHDDKAAIDSLTQAVAAEDALNYSEPPPWYPPVRPMLGRVLLANKQPAEAEKVFRADLERNPRDGRALAGLRDALKAQDRQYEADQIDQQFRAAWKFASSAAASKR
jgi:tetratricopeptide (TPR) repeat protein